MYYITICTVEYSKAVYQTFKFAYFPRVRLSSLIRSVGAAAEAREGSSDADRLDSGSGWHSPL